MMPETFFKYWTVITALMSISFALAFLACTAYTIITYLVSLKKSCYFNRYGIELDMFDKPPTTKQLLTDTNLFTLDRLIRQYNKIVPNFTHYLRTPDVYRIFVSDKRLSIVDIKNNKVIMYLSYTHIVFDNVLIFVVMQHYKEYRKWVECTCSSLQKVLIV